MKIAITGAAGFIGGSLVTWWRAKGAEVLPLVREVDHRSPPGAAPLEHILHTPGRLTGIDVLVHAAAIRHRHGADPRAYRASNVELVDRLIRASAGRVGRLVYVSSVGIYGFPARLPVRESHPTDPRTLYSATKVEAEGLVRSLGPSLGLETSIVRPTIVYGPGDTNGMLDKMARMIRAGTYRVVGDGNNLLHHTYLDDILQGIELAGTVPRAAGDDFILAGPETITLRALSGLVSQVVGRGLPRLPVPLPFARAVAAAVDFAQRRSRALAATEPPVNGEKLDVMTLPIHFDASKAREVLGYRPSVGYQEGVPRALSPGGAHG